MKLILREDIKNLGRAGDTVQVAEGFARNYLLPKKMALLATPNNQKRLAQELNSHKGRERRVQRDAQYQAEKIAEQPLVFTSPAGEAGKLFGSVTTADIEAALAKRGVEIDKRKLELEEPIKMVGTYEVSVRLHPEVTARLIVVVEAKSTPAPTVPESPLPQAPAPEGPPPPEA